ncbi:hypothetical protein BC829DRAFT_224449 [Chytridium lagenaria]|nr:hypothetical protein BC829DRAFT_224449 [Chytridium lagenaria]
MDLGGTSAVSVYNSDFHHLLAISEHLSTGLKAHERAIILASAHHIHIIQSILSSLGHSIHHLTIANHLICVDAPAFLHAICDDDPSIMAYLDLNKDGRKGVLERICASISKHFAVPMEPLSLHGLSGKSPSDQPRMRIYAEVGDLFLRACLRSPGGFGWDAVVTLSPCSSSKAKI